MWQILVEFPNQNKKTKHGLFELENERTGPEIMLLE